MADPNPRPSGDSLGQDSPDPSMEDILASIRRILNDDDGVAAPAEPAAETQMQAQAGAAAVLEEDVFLLDAAMMIEVPPEPVFDEAPKAVPDPPPRSTAKPDTLVAPETLQATSSSMGALVRALTDRQVPITRGNSLTLEDIVRDELRPLVASWLDEHLPPLVERLVGAEIERVVGRAVG